jgi:dTDP-4-dehydrorhamnose 3,5-epimerase
MGGHQPEPGVIFTETPLKGAFLIDLAPRADERGFFARAWCAHECAAYGLNPRLVQANVSHTMAAGTVRGMHFQVAPHQEAKVMRCVRGSIWDAIIDLRPESPTFLRWTGVELSALNHRMLYVPEGFANGYQTLADDSEVFYHVTEAYAPGAERGIRWDDPAVGIEWPDTGTRLVSRKDQDWPALVLPSVRASR